MNSREKGKRGEREVASIFRNEGFHNARRGQQYSGANGDADVVGIPGIHAEVKYVEHLNIHDAMDQSVRDAREGEIPVVIHRKNHTGWLITFRLCDIFQILREWINGLL